MRIKTEWRGLEVIAEADHAGYVGDTSVGMSDAGWDIYSIRLITADGSDIIECISEYYYNEIVDLIGEELYGR